MLPPEVVGGNPAATMIRKRKECNKATSEKIVGREMTVGVGGIGARVRVGR